MSDIKQRIVFFVGPDKTGKTNISKAAAEALSAPYFKAKTERCAFAGERDLFLKQLRYADPRVADLLAQTGVSVTFDRGYPCEKVYSALTHRPTDDAVLRDLDDAYSQLGAVIIFCRRSSYAGLVDDIDPSIGEEKLKQLDALYEAFAREFTKCSVYALTVDDEDIEREVKEVAEFVKHVEWLREQGLATSCKVL